MASLLFVDLQVHIAAEFTVFFTYVGCLLFVLSAPPRLENGLTYLAPEVAFI